jgi:predicted TIM-barrel fold metal-dependent hydrolase
MVQYRFNSADNHLDQRWIPRDLWQDRVAKKFREQAPKVVETDGGLAWSWEGKVMGGRDGGSADGPENATLLEQFFGGSGARLPKGCLPPADPELILEHMDMAGIYGYVGYGSTRKWLIDDPALRMEVHRVYNDWVMELNAVDPDRLLILPHLPTFDPAACPQEMARMAKIGCKAVEFVAFDVAEPTWAAAAEAGIVLCSHIGGAVDLPIPPAEHGNLMAYFSCVPFVAARPIADMVYCGALQRHPELQFSFAECRAGWVPFLVYWMDRQALERPGLFRDTGLDMLPSEYVKRQVTVTFEEDDIAAKLITHEDCILRDILMWGADYPHPQGTWPDPDPIMHKMFDGLDLGLRQQVVFERMRRVFGLDGPAPEQIMPPEEAAKLGAGRERAHASFE